MPAQGINRAGEVPVLVAQALPGEYRGVAELAFDRFGMRSDGAHVADGGLDALDQLARR